MSYFFGVGVARLNLTYCFARRNNRIELTTKFALLVCKFCINTESITDLDYLLSRTDANRHEQFVPFLQNNEYSKISNMYCYVPEKSTNTKSSTSGGILYSSFTESFVFRQYKLFTIKSSRGNCLANIVSIKIKNDTGTYL